MRRTVARLKRSAIFATTLRHGGTREILATVVVNLHTGVNAVYKPEFDSVTNHLTRDYALVLMLPNETKDKRVLLIYGIYTQGSRRLLSIS